MFLARSFKKLALLCVALVALGAVCLAQSPSAPVTAPLPDSIKLVPVKVVRAVYPEAAVKNNVHGQVVVRVVAGVTGEVGEAEVVSGDAALAAAAVEAARQWKFEPFIKDGKPVRAAARLTFDFGFIASANPSPDGIAVPVTWLLGSAPYLTEEEVKRTGDVIHKVAPIYPAIAKAARIQGQNVMQALITKEGAVTRLHVISGHPMLVGAAMDAVRQWRYSPFLIEGEPVEVEIQLRVNFLMRP